MDSGFRLRICASGPEFWVAGLAFGALCRPAMGFQILYVNERVLESRMQGYGLANSLGARFKDDLSLDPPSAPMTKPPFKISNSYKSTQDPMIPSKNPIKSLNPRMPGSSPERLSAEASQHWLCRSSGAAP